MRQRSGHFSHLSSPSGTSASLLPWLKSKPSESPASGLIAPSESPASEVAVLAVPHDASLTEPSALIAVGGANASIVLPPQLASTSPMGTVPSKWRYSRLPKV